MSRALATEAIDLLNTTGFDDMISAFSDDVSIGDLLRSLFYGAFGSLYNIGYGVMLGGIFYLLWHDHKSLVLPSIGILIFGNVLFTLIPESMVMYAKLFALVGIAGVLVVLYRDGRQ